MSMPGDQGMWVVDESEDNGVFIEFNTMGEEGVEHFETSMPPEYALELGQAIIDKARELL